MNSNSRLSRTRTNLWIAQVVLACSALVALLSIPGCKHASVPSDRSSKSSKDSQEVKITSPQEAPAVTVPPAQQGPQFAVQVGAFRSRNTAEALAASMTAQTGSQTLVAPVEVRGKTYYRVRIMIEKKEDAESLAKTLLHTSRLKAWVIALH